MLYGFLVTLFAISCFLIIVLILIQKGKGAMGIGTMGGGSQMLFGSSGGQDLFQKLTWILGTIFIFGALGIGLLRSRFFGQSRYLSNIKAKQEQTQTTQSTESEKQVTQEQPATQPETKSETQEEQKQAPVQN